MTPHQIITPPSPPVDGDDVPFAWADDPRPRPHPFFPILAVAICAAVVFGAWRIAGWLM